MNGGNIECHGQVRIDGKPFVLTRVGGRDFGQLTPRDAISMGTRFIMAAIEAERDAGVLRWMIDEGKSSAEIGKFLTEMRAHRDSADPDADASLFHPRFPH